MEPLAILSIAFIAFAGLFAWAVVQIAHISTAERADLQAAHAAQVEHLCNRIQLPERTAHHSVSNTAPERDPHVDPDVAFERELTLVE